MQVTIEVRDKESQVYTPVKNGNGVLLRVYELGSDGGKKPTALTKSGNIYTLAFTTMDAAIAALTNTANYLVADYDSFRLSVAVIGIDGVENSAVPFERANNVA